jgi:hypothetical protein
LSKVIQKRIENSLSTTHFSAQLPVILSAGIGLLAVLFTVAEISPAWKVVLSAVDLLAMGIATYLLLRMVHYRQAAFWKLYTLVSMHGQGQAGEVVDLMSYDELMALEDVIAKIAHTENLWEQTYIDLFKEARDMIERKHS